jgi:hypothetical protein
LESETLAVAVTGFIWVLGIFVGGLVLKVMAALLPKNQLLNSPWENPHNGSNKIMQERIFNLMAEGGNYLSRKDRKYFGKDSMQTFDLL